MDKIQKKIVLILLVSIATIISIYAFSDNIYHEFWKVTYHDVDFDTLHKNDK